MSHAPPPVADKDIKDEVHPDPVGKPQDIPTVLNPDDVAPVQNPENGSDPIPSILNLNASNDTPKGNGDGSGVSNAPPPVAENNINDEVRPVGKPEDAPVPSNPKSDEIANGSNDPLKVNDDPSAVSNPPPPIVDKDINNKVCPIGKPEDAPSILNLEDIAKPKANGDSSGVNNPPPVADMKGDTSSDLVNNEAPKSDENVSLGHPETPEPVSVVKKEDSVESVKNKEDTKKRDDTSNAGARPHFVNFLGRKTVISKPLDVMHAENKSLPLYEMCRLFLGINRDTASAFSSYSKMKVYYHKFQSTGLSERQFSVSQIDD